MNERLAILTLATAFVLGACAEKPATDAPPAADIRFVVDDARTEAYIRTLDLRAIERLGSDFVNPRYDPTRIGKTLDEIDPHCDFDFEHLEEVERRLDGVDRRRVLEHVFRTVTAAAETDTERHVALLRFLHRASYHCSKLRPMYRDCVRCWDPVVLLELNEMHCTHAGRVAVDLWEAGGYEARLVNFGAKTTAEVYYEGQWHYFGPDSCGGNGIVLRRPDGVIPSWVELSRNPEWIDVLPYRYELNRRGSPRVSGTPCRSQHCFYYTGGRPPAYKMKSRPAEPGEFNYGWGNMVAHAPDWEYDDGGRPKRYQPGVVRFSAVHVEPARDGSPARFRIEWRPAIDRDGDLIGYRVFVGSAPRGWSYSKFAGSRAARAYWSNDGGWRPEMYDALYRLPPHDVARLQTTEPAIELEVPAGEPRYVTIMAYDAYHERIGKEMYLMSNELAIGAEKSLRTAAQAGDCSQ
jgi:hypothetical protein